MRWILMAVLAMGALLCGQENAAESAASRLRVVPVKNANVDDVFRTVSKLGGPVSATTSGNNIVLSGSPVWVQALEDTIHKLDVPPQPKKDIELIAYMLLASRSPHDNGASYPPELERVVSQFKSLLAYKSFRLLDSVQIRAHEGSRIDTQGIFSLSPEAKPTSYQFRADRAEVDGGNMHLRGLSLNLTIPSVANFLTARISTDVDIQPNQKVAVGKASVDPNGDALILVISAKVVD